MPVYMALRTGQVSQKFIDGGQFVIIHSSDRTPRHLFPEFMAVGVDVGAHGGDELRKLPVLDMIEVGSERPHLLAHAAGPTGALASATTFKALALRHPPHA